LILDTELTNSDTTNKKRETLFGDIPISIAYSHIWSLQGDETRLGFGPSFSLGLPTSKLSYKQGRYLTTSLGAGTRSIVKLAGKSSKWFPSVLIGASASYAHIFSRATTPTTTEANAAGLDLHRQTSTGADFLSDQIGSKEFNIDNLRLTLVYYLTLYKDLSLGNLWEVSVPFKKDFKGTNCDVNISTGCVTADRDPTRTHGIPTTTFDVSLSYNILDIGRVDLGYNSTTSQLAEDGTRRSVFYNPDATFYLDMVAYIDGIADKAYKSTKKKSRAAARNQLAQLPSFGQIFTR
jgi:hypothetical protein